MEFLRRVPQWFRDEADTQIDTLTLSPNVVFRLEEIRLHLAAIGGVGAGSFTVSVESHVSTEYDVQLIAQDMAAITDYVFRPSADMRVLFDKGDSLVFDWANANNVQYGLEVIWSQVSDAV